MTAVAPAVVVLRALGLGDLLTVVPALRALADALATGQLSAVALDVFPDEPPRRHRLYDDPRTICTPHAIGLSARWNEQVFHSLARDVAALLAGQPPANLLNPEALTCVRQRFA